MVDRIFPFLVMGCMLNSRNAGLENVSYEKMELSRSTLPLHQSSTWGLATVVISAYVMMALLPSPMCSVDRIIPFLVMGVHA